MDRSVNAPTQHASSGGALGFVAARRRRRQRLVAAPQLRWYSIAPSVEPPHSTADASVWTLLLRNDGGGATDARVTLFTTDAIYRSAAGTDGRITQAEGCDLTLELDHPDGTPSLRGYVLARGTDRRWYATTVDGRSASFRTEPDELGVLRTLGLKLPVNAVEHDRLVHSAATDLPQGSSQRAA